MQSGGICVGEPKQVCPMRTLHNVHKLNTFKVVVWDLEVQDNAPKTMELVCNEGISALKTTINLSISSSVFNPPQLSVTSLPPVFSLADLHDPLHKG